MYRRILFLLIISFSVDTIQAQQPLSATAITTGTSSGGTSKFYYATSQKHEAPRAIVFNEPTVTAADFLTNINSYFDIPVEFSFAETESNTDNLGMRHHFMEQHYKGIPLEGLAYRVHERNGFVTSANGKAIRKMELDVTTILSEQQAFDLAVEHLKTKDTVFRNARKLIVSKDFTFTPKSFSVAFQFDIDVSLIERWRISIDARNGQVINKVSLVNSCLAPPPPEYSTGTGLTNYYGPQTIRVERRAGESSMLNGQTEHGGRFGTRDFGNAHILSLFFFPNETHGPIFTSADNTYDDPYQQAAVSVHWAVEQTYEYYFNEHNRNSHNNNGGYITSYVHVHEDLDNAFWTGKVLAFGDGSNNNAPVELDIVSHEFTHAVTQHEAELTYQYEPGALNESFSDIFGKAVEFTTFGSDATWQIGRHFRNGGIRDMSDPNRKSQPDTYKGDLWYDGVEDNGGVHINSGVQNFWFYLLCEGGTGVNDRGVNYSVNSIGMDTAVNIAYRNLTEYLISSSDYLDCRIGSLLAAADLYGANSSAYREVDKAWDAVGVIDEPIITSLNLYDITATTVKLKGSLLPRGDTVTYHFEYGTTPDFGSSTAVYDYTGTVEGVITGLQSETTYYVRLVATNENGNSYSATEFTTISLAPLVKIKHTVDVSDTSATLYGQVNPNSRPTSFYFEYGPTPAMELVTPSYPLSDTTEFLEVSAPVDNLLPRQIYYYKLVAANDFASSETDSVKLFTALKPVISSFSPVTATIGSVITITGQHFHSTPESNLVSFGASRAKVLSSSSTEIQVEVPAGASFGPISVLDAESGRVAESIHEFVPTYTGDFGKGGLQLRAAFDEITIYEMEVYDMDGDGRPDIVGSHSEGITVFQNVNTGGDITGESFVRSNIPIDDYFSFQSLADFDGNGLKDVVGDYGDGVRIYPNFSVPGFIFFGVPVDVPVGRWQNILFNDFDNDGHIDIAGTSSFSGDSCMFTVFRNQSPKGALSANSFEQRYLKILSHDYIRSLAAEDLNNDGMPDLMASAYNKDYFSVLLNNSSPGVFDFEEIIVQDSIRGRLAKYAAQDLNHDGWKDIASLSLYETGELALFQNSGSNVALSKPVLALEGHRERFVQAGDIDGDGNVDLLVGDYDGRFIFLKNKMGHYEHFSDSSFELFEHYGINENDHEVESDILLNDLNGDGKPEVINNLNLNFAPYTGHQLEIWQNAPNDCLDPSLIGVNASRKTATVVLPSHTTLDDFEIEYAYVTASDWRQLSSTTITYLSTGGTYKLRARAKCYLGFTDYHYIEFTTECVDLESFRISDIQINDVTLSATNLGSFEVQYSEAGKDVWKTLSRWSEKIIDLLPGTTYDLRYRGQCDAITEFNYMQFTTLCPALSKIDIDDITFNSALASAISSSVGDAMLAYSADSVSWIAIDETRTMFPLVPGREYFVRGKLACTNIDSDFIYTSFTTFCPKVSELSVDAITPFSAHVSWMDESQTGSYTIRYTTPSGETKAEVTNSTSFDLDELSPGTQYTVSVAPECIGSELITTTSFTTVCYVPFDVSADAITHTAAELSWEDDFGGFPYYIDYSIVGSNDWSTKMSTGKNVSLTELRPGTQYEARVHIHCVSVSPPYASVHFETSLYGETVFAPNPTTHIVTIYPSKNVIGNRFDIYDDTGRRVAGGELTDYAFDLSDLSAGTYILKIDGEEPMRIVKR